MRPDGAKSSFSCSTSARQKPGLGCTWSRAERTASCVAVDQVEALVLYRNDFQAALEHVEARKRTTDSVGIEEFSGARATERRRSSVRDALEAAAGANLQALLAQDAARRAAARAAVAGGGAPAAPPGSVPQQEVDIDWSAYDDGDGGLLI